MPAATGGTNLAHLLATMQPVRHPGEYVFCTASPAMPVPRETLGWFREPEGCTFILPRAAADAHGLPYSFVAAWLTLTVHSSMEAVGLTAAVAAALTKESISCNVVAGYYHDHLFVAHADAERALGALQNLSTQTSNSAPNPTP